jgi:Zn-dependent membrane protease YugP
VLFSVAVHFPFVTTPVAFTGATGVKVKIESKSAVIDM